jgi:hypothetical protein
MVSSNGKHRMGENICKLYLIRDYYPKYTPRKNRTHQQKTNNPASCQWRLKSGGSWFR